jgi:glycine C-acetyltransferase
MAAIASTYEQQLNEMRDAGRFKSERIITTPQRAAIDTTAREGVINFCANNYLGLASHPDVIAAAHEALDRWGFGLASVRFICGTQQLHKDLENTLTEFLGTEDTILYSSCFDANGGLFETLLTPDDAIISDELNHASIIDGVRLCKAKRYRYLQQRHGGPGSEAKAGRRRRREAETDHHRRRVLDGRAHRQAR